MRALLKVSTKMKSYFYLLAIGLLWGSQFIFMHQAVADFSPFVVAAGRAIFGFITLWILCKFLNLKSEKLKVGTYMVVALLDATLPFILVAWGQQFVDSAIASVLMGTIPFMTILLAPLVISGEKITKWGISSVTLGFAGVLVLFAPQLTAAGSAGLMGSVAILSGAACFALGMLIIKRLTNEHPILVARNILACSAIQLSVVAAFTVDFQAISFTSSSLGALVLLGVFCTGLVYFLFMSLIQLSGPTFASLSNYLVPMFGVLLGALWLGEQVSGTMAISLVMILGSVALNQWGKGREQTALAQKA